MKKILSIILLGSALLSISGLEAFRGRRHGGRHGGRGGHHRRHGGWGRRGFGGPGFGFGISIGGPRYYEPAPVEYIDNPYDWYWGKNPRASWDSYVRWLELNNARFRRPWRSYYGSRYQRRWRARPRIGFGIGFGF